MTPELARLMQNARDYPNTATVDHLCAGIAKTLEMVQAAERMAATVEREACAEIAEGRRTPECREYCGPESSCDCYGWDDLREIAARIRSRSNQTTAGRQENQCPNPTPS